MALGDTTATIKDLQGDLKQLRDDVSKLAQRMTASLSGIGNEAIDQVEDSRHRMRKDLDEAVIGANKRGGEAFGKVSENCRESLHEHPVTAVALAVGLGFLFGTACHR